MHHPVMKNILITGPPGSGKTTLVRTIAHGLKDLCPAGFYTAEIRVNGVRQGFELVSLSGERRILSHVTFKGPHRVGKYGVDVNAFEEFLDALPAPDSRCPVFIIDEIGKMETFSARFCRMVEDIFTSGIPCIATIAEKGNDWIETIKLRNDIEVIALTIKNRPVLADQITGRMKTIANDRR